MDRPLRVLLLTETFYPEVGGGERQARILARALVQRGHSVTVVTRRSRADLAAVEQDGGVRVVRISPGGTGRWKKWGLAMSALVPLVRLRPADAVLVSGYRIMGVPAVLVCGLGGGACVLKADSLGEMSGDFFRAGLAQLRLTPATLGVRQFISWRNALLRRADAFVTISGAITRELEEHRVAPRRIHYIPNAVDTTRFMPACASERMSLRRRLGLPEGRVLVYTGRLVSYKGLPRLLQAWRTLSRAGAGGSLVVVGAGGTDMHACEKELREFVAHERLHDSVMFTGEVENVDEYLRAADGFVFPTENEAFGVSLIEAMACGLPSVATRAGGIPDFIVHGENGLLIDPGSSTQLQEGMAQLLAGGEAIAALGRAARVTAVARFSTETVVDQYVQLFMSLMSSHTGDALDSCDASAESY